MSLFLLLGAIAAIIYYIYQMRANARAENEELNDANKKRFERDIFYPSDNEYNNETLYLSDPYEDIEKLAALHEKGILTKEEYEAKKKELLDRI